MAMADLSPLHALTADSPVVDSCEGSSAAIPVQDQPTITRIPAHTGPSISTGQPRLSLSAFRRHAIRLTNADPDRSLTAAYDLNALGSRGVLGHGAFSTVRLAVRKADGLKVAVKTIAKHEALRSRRLRVGGRHYIEEWEILRRFHDHPCIIGLLDIFETDEEIQLVLEYCEGGELFAAIQKKRCRSQSARRYSEAETAQITYQILHALSDLHSAGIVHRDVKAENILLVTDKEDDVQVKLCDFGLARPLVDEESGSESEHTDDEDGLASPSPVVTPGRIQRSYSIVGSDYYTAPEVGFTERYSPAMDVYSLGVTVYILLCGFPPVFAGDDETEVMFPSSYWKDISPEAITLVKNMLQPSPSLRISAKQALSDPWVLKYSHAALANSHPRTNLDLVCRRLYSSVAAEAAAQSKKRSFAVAGAHSPRRRTRMRSSTVVMALADICRGMTAIPPEAVDRCCLSATTSSMAVQTGLSAGLCESDSEGPATCFTSSPTVAAL